MADPIVRHLVPTDGVPVPLPDTHSTHDTGARLATALLAYLAVVTAVVTLLPFEFAVPVQPRVMLSGGVVDVVANVVLFVPLGFLYAVSRADQPTRASRIFLAGLATSAILETLQLFEASRYAAISDVLANGTGAYLGAVVQRRLARRISMDARTVGKLSLELPVMGLVYLLVPLL
ncbi:MAG TPA: VanZ family protein, partial [Gemmatimonadaceae bacterium]|nr:VanZ family protein [Gemmatimonadaceae bacterium]